MFIRNKIFHEKSLILTYDIGFSLLVDVQMLIRGQYCDFLTFDFNFLFLIVIFDGFLKTLPNCVFIRVFEKFHPTCLLGPTCLLNIKPLSIQHVYLDYTFIRNTRVLHLQDNDSFVLLCS